MQAERDEHDKKMKEERERLASLGEPESPGSDGSRTPGGSLKRTSTMAKIFGGEQNSRNYKQI
jgi:hypothetical protein